MKSALLDATCRVAFAGLIHDLGKFAQRAGIDVTKMPCSSTNSFIARSVRKGDGYGGPINTRHIQDWPSVRWNVRCLSWFTGTFLPLPRAKMMTGT